MTEKNPAIFLQAGSHPAEDVRRMLAGLTITPGVVDSTDMAVTQNGTPNMTVQVAGGRAFIRGSEATYQGTYFVENRGATTGLVIATADATNPRIDLIVAKVEDAGYSGATNAWSLAVVTGTPAASPSAPSAPNNSLVLARVAVAALASSITNANITDYRFLQSGQQAATALGGVIRGLSTNRPTSGITEGQFFYETDTDIVQVYDGSNWIPYGKTTGNGTSWTPTIRQNGACGTTVTLARYVRIGNFVFGMFDVTCTSSAGAAGNTVTIDLPFTTSLSGNGSMGHCSIYDASTVTRYLATLENGGSGRAGMVGDWAGGGNWGLSPAIQIANGDIIRGQIAFML